MLLLTKPGTIRIMFASGIEPTAHELTHESDPERFVGYLLILPAEEEMTVRECLTRTRI
jgi:hypothetical protein